MRPPMAVNVEIRGKVTLVSVRINFSLYQANTPAVS